MKTVCIGGGPAALYFAISAKLRDAGHDITVIERDPAGATYGWGVVYWDDLLDILGERATDLGVDVQYRREVTDTSTDSAGLLEKTFEHALDGHSLISQSRGEPARWQRFTHVTNKTWCHDNLVLVGDAAHTTHFTLGSGTRLAMIDALMLAQSIYEHQDPTAAARDYDRRGRAALRPIQAGARSSMAWFERADRYHDAVTFVYAMSAWHGSQPPWRYQMHLATQIPAARTAMRGVDTARRWYLARRRGEPTAVPRNA